MRDETGIGIDVTSVVLNVGTVALAMAMAREVEEHSGRFAT